MPQSIFSISAAEKESKIAKVAHLIPKYYDELDAKKVVQVLKTGIKELEKENSK